MYTGAGPGGPVRILADRGRCADLQTSVPSSPAGSKGPQFRGMPRVVSVTRVRPERSLSRGALEQPECVNGGAAPLDGFTKQQLRFDASRLTVQAKHIWELREEASKAEKFKAELREARTELEEFRMQSSPLALDNPTAIEAEEMRLLQASTAPLSELQEFHLECVQVIAERDSLRKHVDRQEAMLGQTLQSNRDEVTSMLQAFEKEKTTTAALTCELEVASQHARRAEQAQYKAQLEGLQELEVQRTREAQEKAINAVELQVHLQHLADRQAAIDHLSRERMEALSEVSRIEAESAQVIAQTESAEEKKIKRSKVEQSIEAERHEMASLKLRLEVEMAKHTRLAGELQNSLEKVSRAEEQHRRTHAQREKALQEREAIEAQKYADLHAFMLQLAARQRVKDGLGKEWAAQDLAPELRKRQYAAAVEQMKQLEVKCAQATVERDLVKRELVDQEAGMERAFESAIEEVAASAAKSSAAVQAAESYFVKRGLIEQEAGMERAFKSAIEDGVSSTEMQADAGVERASAAQQDARVREPETGHSQGKALRASLKAIRLAPECLTEDCKETKVRHFVRKGTGFARTDQLPREDEDNLPEAVRTDGTEMANGGLQHTRETIASLVGNAEYSGNNPEFVRDLLVEVERLTARIRWLERAAKTSGSGEVESVRDEAASLAKELAVEKAARMSLAAQLDAGTGEALRVQLNASRAEREEAARVQGTLKKDLAAALERACQAEGKYAQAIADRDRIKHEAAQQQAKALSASQSRRDEMATLSKRLEDEQFAKASLVRQLDEAREQTFRAERERDRMQAEREGVLKEYQNHCVKIAQEREAKVAEVQTEVQILQPSKESPSRERVAVLERESTEEADSPMRSIVQRLDEQTAKGKQTPGNHANISEGVGSQPQSQSASGSPVKAAGSQEGAYSPSKNISSPGESHSGSKLHNFVQALSNSSSGSASQSPCKATGGQRASQSPRKCASSQADAPPGKMSKLLLKALSPMKGESQSPSKGSQDVTESVKTLQSALKSPSRCDSQSQDFSKGNSSQADVQSSSMLQVSDANSGRPPTTRLEIFSSSKTALQSAQLLTSSKAFGKGQSVTISRPHSQSASRESAPNESSRRGLARTRANLQKLHERLNIPSTSPSKEQATTVAARELVNQVSSKSRESPATPENEKASSSGSDERLSQKFNLKKSASTPGMPQLSVEGLHKVHESLSGRNTSSIATYRPSTPLLGSAPSSRPGTPPTDSSLQSRLASMTGDRVLGMGTSVVTPGRASSNPRAALLVQPDFENTTGISTPMRSSDTPPTPGRTVVPAMQQSRSGPLRPGSMNATPGLVRSSSASGVLTTTLGASLESVGIRNHGLQLGNRTSLAARLRII